MGLDVAEIGMGLDLGLDLRLFAGRSAGRMASAAKAGAPAAVDACIRSLEEERRKIEVFRRELPLCVRLLADVIEELKEEAVKMGGAAEAKADDGDKKKWMSTAQLWVDGNTKSESEKERKSEITSPEPKLLGGAPMPLRAVASVPPTPAAPYARREDKQAAGAVGLPGPGLPVLPQAVKRPLSPPVGGHADDVHSLHPFATIMPPVLPAGLNLDAQVQHRQQQQQQQQQQARKSRRCWSPELHQQFVDALHQLGGPQVATPKQIRDVMQVDGLTNDEVKSHLQKYRLHNRRSPGAAPSPPIMLVGGLWVPNTQSSSQSGSPDGPLQFSGASVSGVAASAGTGGDSGSSDEDDEGDCRKRF